ncbi:MAG: FG-GAP-like repeat-containing protein [Balneolaceae bacterium]
MMKRISLKATFLFVFVAAGVLLVWNHTRNNQPDTTGEITDPELLEGKLLSETWCASCHAFPDPKLLPWSVWRFETLPAMRPFMGLSGESGFAASSSPWLPENVYPSDPLVSEAEWEKIRNYYLQMAPRELEPSEKSPGIVTDSLFFRARVPDHTLPEPSRVTAVALDPGNSLIYLGEAGGPELQVYDSNLQRTGGKPVASVLSEIRIPESLDESGVRNLILTEMGIMDPVDGPFGSVSQVRFNPDSARFGTETRMVTDISRPTQAQYADLTGDGRKELLINEFGHRAGGLFWLERDGDGWEGEKHILTDSPGCIRSRVLDYTGNGLSDVVALCAQADQALYLFRNQGDGDFERQTLLRFEVTAGSTSFSILDFNEDGLLDILYTSGDNADYSKVFKPYHGVYIYLNEGDDQFQEAWFYPVNGAYDAKAEDFNGDGRLDLAVISYFADYEQSPGEGFLLFLNEESFLNEGGPAFTPYHHPAATSGRWLSMDVADWTGNGRPDILLGNFSEGPIMVDETWRDRWQSTPPFLILENRLN